MPPAQCRERPLATEDQPVRTVPGVTGCCSSADAKVKELEQDAYDGRRPSYNAAGPPLHDEPEAYIPQEVPQHMPWLMQLPGCTHSLQPSRGGVRVEPAGPLRACLVMQPAMSAQQQSACTWDAE